MFEHSSMPPTIPWHAGEVALQQQLGVAERMAQVGPRVIRDFMPEQHRDFYRQLPFMLIGTVDAAGNPWASILEGLPGFVRSPDARLLQFDCTPAAGDPAAQNLSDGAAVGLLGIELHSRRRNRINGHVQRTRAAGFSVAVEQSFGNCPQYIQRRAAHFSQAPAQLQAPAAQQLSDLDDAARALISAADTCFVASYVDPAGDAQRRSVDVSHRGGQTGFVQVAGNSLSIPDFAGNQFFNTLGNLHLNPRAGLLFIDFNNGDLLHVSGHTEIIFDGPQVRAFQGAERLWRLHVTQVIRRPAALALRWDFEDFSPNSLMTGSWQQAQERLHADALRDQWRSLQVVRIEDESSNIRSFYLQPTDGAGLPLFEAGQHLPIRLQLPGSSTALIRTYSLSSAPSDDFFRISVKRQGLISSHLHAQIMVGDLLQTRAPQGRFFVDPREARPLVLLAAGVGVTPLLAMLREVVYQGQRLRHTRPTYFVQSARTLAELPFKAELQALASRAGDDLHVVRLLSQPEPEAREGDDFELGGRINLALLKALLPFDDFDFYLCGPSHFTQELYDSLRTLNIADGRIHAETFGPSTLRRQGATTAPAEQPPAASAAVPVLFAHSGTEARWTPASGSLLELAESRGLTPEFSCRGGSCGTCKTRIVSGQVHYPNPPAELPAAGEVLICCAVPAQHNDGPNSLVLDL